jgi:hypothetical protein
LQDSHHAGEQTAATETLEVVVQDLVRETACAIVAARDSVVAAVRTMPRSERKQVSRRLRQVARAHGEAVEMLLGRRSAPAASTPVCVGLPPAHGTAQRRPGGARRSSRGSPGDADSDGPGEAGHLHLHLAPPPPAIHAMRCHLRAVGRP